MTKFHHVQSQDLSVHQDDAPGLLLVPVQFLSKKNNEKGVQDLATNYASKTKCIEMPI